jgi:two-component system sensor histidine kinase YesM
MMLSWHNLKIKNIKMQNKLILCLLSLSFIPLVISGVFSASSSNKTIKEKISTYSVQLMNQVGENISVSMLKLRNNSDDIMVSTSIYNQLLGYQTAHDTDKAITRMNLVQSMILKFLNMDNIDDVLMILNSSRDSSRRDIAHIRVQYTWKEDDIDRIIRQADQKDNERNFVLSLANIGAGNDDDIIVCRKMENILSSNVLGYFMIAVNQEYLRSIYRDIDMGRGSDIFIMNSRGIVMSSNNPEIVIGRPFQDSRLFERIHRDDIADGRAFSLKIEGQDKLIAFSRIEKFDWYVVGMIPYSYLNSETSKFSYRIAMLTLVISLLAIVLSFIISQSISAPIRELARQMAHFTEDMKTENAKVDRQDEIGHLQKSYNLMASNIKELLAKNEEENRLRRITELKVLEYQINPHFLYNTLDSINWMAQKRGQTDISLLVTALARFFRLGLSKGNEIYTIRDEIEHVNNYLIISRYRYKDCFEFSMEIDPAIMNCKTIKIILQPIVENAIKHGINKNENEGRILISGRKDGSKVILEVSDNGKGMEKDQVDYINNTLLQMKDITLEKSGFGMINVHQRIRLYYGGDYGVAVESRPGEGTVVRITLPLLT